MATAWVWMIMEGASTLRLYKDGLAWHSSYGTGFATREEAHKVFMRTRARYLELREVCRNGGSDIGVENWTKCLDSIRVTRIKLPESKGDGHVRS